MGTAAAPTKPVADSSIKTSSKELAISEITAALQAWMPLLETFGGCRPGARMSSLAVLRITPSDNSLASLAITEVGLAAKPLQNGQERSRDGRSDQEGRPVARRADSSVLHDNRSRVHPVRIHFKAL